MSVRLVAVLFAAVVAGASAAQDPAGVVLTKDIAYSTNANARGVMDMAKPAGPGPHPALLVLHGGQFTTGERASLQPVLTRYAARGYVTASVTYRLAPGSQFPAAIQDVKGAIRFLRVNAERFAIDPERICAVGFDAGGTLALLAALTPGVPEFEIGGPARETSSRVACAASFSAPTDLKGMAAVPGFAESLELFLGGTPAGAKQAYALASPINWATPDAPRIHMIHGDADRVVPIEQSRMLVARLKSVGATVSQLTVTKGGHDFSPRDTEVSEGSLFAFLDRTIGKATPERVVIVADHGGRRQIVAMAWPSGRELWTQPNAGGHDVQPLPNGNVLIAMGPEKKVVEVNQAKEIVWTYGVDEGLEHPISAQRLPNGNTLIGDAVIGKVIEVDSSRKIVWEYADAAELGKMRMRNSRRTAAGTTLIANEAGGKIIEVNPAGQIIWTYAGVGERRRPYRAIRLPSGNTLITMTSPGELVEVDPAGKIVRTVGGAGSDVKLIWASGFDVFSNGNVLLSDYLGRRIMEVDPAGKIVNEVRMPTRTTASVAVVK